jgi:hypothetical protein
MWSHKPLFFHNIETKLAEKRDKILTYKYLLLSNIRNFKVQMFLCLINKALRHEDVWAKVGTGQLLLTYRLDDGEWLDSHCVHFTHRE